MPGEQLDTRAGAALIVRSLRAEWPSLLVGLVFAFVWSGARLGIPILTGETIDRAIDRTGGADVTLLAALALGTQVVATAVAAAVAHGTKYSPTYRPPSPQTRL